jgi:hypothetical protein
VIVIREIDLMMMMITFLPKSREESRLIYRQISSFIALPPRDELLKKPVLEPYVRTKSSEIPSSYLIWQRSIGENVVTSHNPELIFNRSTFNFQD